MLLVLDNIIKKIHYLQYLYQYLAKALQEFVPKLPRRHFNLIIAFP